MVIVPDAGSERKLDGGLDLGLDVTLIGIDWGSTSLRIFLISREGKVLRSRASAHGVSAMQGTTAAYAGILHKVAGDWLDAYPGVPMLACGMVGSKHGWQEVPYTNCPANAADMACGAAVVDLHEATMQRVFAIAPGVLHRPIHGAPDVMRGEETQVIGALLTQAAWARRSCIIMPGTHSKWAHIEAEQIVSFATHMTGELFAVLRQYSVLGRLMPTPVAQASEQMVDQASFIAGIDAARDGSMLGLAHQLFSVRTLGLMEDIPGSGLADYLSGLLIGHELVAGLAWRASKSLAADALILIGDTSLCQRYANALQRFDIEATAVLDNTAPAGLFGLALAAGLISKAHA